MRFLAIELIISVHMDSRIKGFKCPLIIPLLAFACVPVINVAAATSSLNPPPGNKLFMELIGRGVQVYRCGQSQNGLTHSLSYASASLYWGSNFSFRDPVGIHYFLPYPDGHGGQPTWSYFSGETNAPSSTVTGAVKLKIAGAAGTIPNLLLQATSHSGCGDFHKVSYIKRSGAIGGGAPPSCNKIGAVIKVRYRALYSFYERETDAPVGVPLAISIPSEAHLPFISYFGEGVQMYSFNGSAWELKNVSARLFSLPGQQVIGRHFFLSRPDAGGGQPTWETFMPSSVVTARVENRAVVDSDSIPWASLKATSHRGGGQLLGLVSYVQRVSTTGGKEPESIVGAKIGDSYASPYSAIYWFYVGR